MAKESVPIKVFGDCVCACDGYATLNIEAQADSLTLVHLAGVLSGLVESGTDVGRVPIIGKLQRRYTVDYEDRDSTQDIVEWGDVELAGCTVALREGNNMIAIATPGTYRLVFNAPDLMQCITTYYERITAVAIMIHSSIRKI